MSQKNNATVFIANLPLPKGNKLVSSFFDLWITILKKTDIDLFNKIERGDILENAVEHGYRASGVYMFDKNDAGEVTICDIETDWDDYGTIPRRFELVTQFKNPEYWIDQCGSFTSPQNFTFCDDDDDNNPQADFHNSCIYIPFSKLHDFVTLATQEDKTNYDVDTLNTIKISYEGDIYFVTDSYLYRYYHNKLTGTDCLLEEPKKKNDEYVNDDDDEDGDEDGEIDKDKQIVYDEDENEEVTDDYTNFITNFDKFYVRIETIKWIKAA